jgi:nitrile hydratase accessory protein
MTSPAIEEPRLPGREGGPVFAEPWQAVAFATVVQLSQAGLFTWADWVTTFSRIIARDPQGANEDGDAAYYRQWLTALEEMLAERGVLTGRDIAETAEHWRRSYLHTPHGEPVALRRDLVDLPDGLPTHDHHHDNPVRPATVSVSRRA